MGPRTLPPDVTELARHGVAPDVQVLIAESVDRAYRAGGHDALTALVVTCERIVAVQPAVLDLVRRALIGWDRIPPITTDEALG